MKIINLIFPEYRFKLDASKLIIYSGICLLAACGATNPPVQSDGHIQPQVKDNKIPAPVVYTPTLKRPQKRPQQQTYTVVVNQVPVKEVLFSMARDAHINLDIANNIKGRVTMNAIDQSLPKILDRLAELTAITYTIKSGTVIVKADVPVLKTYNVNYLNIERSSEGKVSISTEIGTTSGGIKKSGSGGAGGSGDNRAKTSVESKTKNQFWTTLEDNISRIIAKVNSDGSTADTKKLKTVSDVKNNIIVNRESGTITVRATSKQHRVIGAFINKVVGSAQRQVLIEATVAEVRLSDKYQAGVDWSVLGEKATIGGQSVLKKGGIQNIIGGNLGVSPFFELAGTGSINGNPLEVTLKALETFGNVKVLSSPKIMALNNQTAILKVVDNEVYFTTNVQLDSGSVNQNSTTVVDTQIHTVPIGFVMSVTPFIDDEDEVTLNVRPTISRIIRYVEDPNPELVKQGVVSRIPVIQVREIETMLKIKNRDTAVIGGLMQDQVDKSNQGVPILSSLPLLGNLFSYRDENYVKTELVIFIRPVVIHNASLNGDLSKYKKYLNIDINKKSSARTINRVVRR